MISSSQRPLPDNTQHSQDTDVHTPGGIRTHDLSRRAAVDLRLRPRGHWNRHSSAYKTEFISWKLWEFRCRMWSSKYAAFAFSVILKVWRSFAVTLCYVTICSVWHVVIAMYYYHHRHLFCVEELLARWRCWKRLLASSCLSVRPSAWEQLGSHWTDFHEIWYLSIFRNLSRKFKFHWNPIRMAGILHEPNLRF